MNPHPAYPAKEVRLSDADITAAVEMLLMKKGVCSYLLKTTCRHGIVELVGFTDSLLSRERAVDIAKAVRGVRGVITEISIRTQDVPDEELQLRVEHAIRQDPAAGEYNVRCHAHDGKLTLDGTLQSWAEAQLVLRVIMGVPGVRQVIDHLRVREGDVINTDEEITAQIREFLIWDIRVKSALVDIHTERSVVHLSGTVGTNAERDQVVALAYVAGATRVDARDLTVAYWAFDKALRREKFTPKADEAIADAIRDTYRYDPRVRQHAPTVRVRGGEVTLSGFVSNLQARQAAELDARNVVGVWDVHNLLQVRAPKAATDGHIQQQVKQALAADSFLGRYTFTVNVSNGKAQLYGTVDSHFDQERAEEVASGVNGVVELVNHVRLSAARDEPFAPSSAFVGGRNTPSPLSSTEPDFVMEQRIRTHYYWSALLHDQDINVGVVDGRVTLTGTVETWVERKRAATEAYDCGARDVNNHLQVHTAAKAAT